MPDSTSRPTTICPNCSAKVTGRFCSECGAALEGAKCAACHEALTPGARFCHHCGLAVGGSAAAMTSQASFAREPRSLLPWGVAAVALLALIALVASQRFGSGAADGQAATFPIGGSAVGSAGAPAPDISQMSPRERADRLFDRVMRLSGEGKADSAQFFASMAISVYPSLAPLDDDLRYDYGRVAEVAGAQELARAQADTILKAHPTHLLGLALALRAAQMRGDSAAARDFARRLVGAEPAETAKNLPEYERHRADILQTLADARKRP